MTEPEQFSFTVSPYDEDAAPMERIRPSIGVAHLPAGLWLGAAVIAVVGNFLPVLKFVFDGRLAKPTSPDRITVSYNGWGQPSFHNTVPDDPGEALNSGARWAWVVLAAAMLLVLAAAWSVRSGRRLRLLGPEDVALAGIFMLAGSIVALILSFGPDRHQLTGGNNSPTRLHWGWYWPVELVAFAAGLVGWLWYRQLEDRAASPTLAADVVEPESSYRQTENWFDEARDRPGTPTDPGPSPW